jgi:peptide/nickel transport system permease protein
MATLTADSPQAAQPSAKPRINRWDSPWLNPKLITGLVMVLAVAFSGIVGDLFWDLRLARVGTSPQDLPPAFLEGGSWAHPLGTENSGRDMLAVLLVGAPRSLRIGLIAAAIGLVVGVILGCLAGFLGGFVDRFILIISDAWITIPSLVVLIVISAFVPQISAETLAVLIALFAWPGPTRLIRAQVLTLRERGYIRMARLSGANTLM